LFFDWLTLDLIAIYDVYFSQGRDRYHRPS
jgi:hypothetical protein